MNKLKLTGILLLVAGTFGVTLTAKADNISVCVNGICVDRDRDGIDLRPDWLRPRPPRPMPPPPRWPHEPVRGYEYVTCESRDHNLRYCYFNPAWVRRVTLNQVHSRAACIGGRTYGIQRDYVWVDQGCRATFLIER